MLSAEPVDVLWRLYDNALPTAKARIVAFEPVSDRRFRLTAINEDPGYYQLATSDLTAPFPSVVFRVPSVVAVQFAAVRRRQGDTYAVHIEATLTVAGEWRGGVVRAGADASSLRTVAHLLAGDTVAKWEVPSDVTGQVVEIVPGTERSPNGPVWRGRWGFETSVVPPALTGVTVTELPNGTRKYDWTPPDIPDFAGVVIRHSADESDAWAGMTPLHDGLLTFAPYETKSPAPGTWTFAFRAASTAGALSEAVRISATLGETDVLPPSVYDDITQRADDAIANNPAFDALDQAVADAEAEAARAVAAALGAAGSATTATQAVSDAEDEAERAAAEALAAAGSATAADGSATAAAGSATTASQRATAAAGSATAAASRATAAAASATAARRSATAASSSATSASASASTAGEKAEAARVEATSASTSASDAGTYASDASEAETNADGSATAAAASARAAAASATAAGGSATAASSSASTASSKATEAGASASAASLFATAASTDAGRAATSVTQASASEDNAGDSATAAALSATAAAGSADDAEAAVAGISATVSTAVGADLTTRFASVVGLRAKAGGASADLELVALSDPSGEASALKIRADQVLVGDQFSIESDSGKLTLDSINANVVKTGTLTADRITADVQNYTRFFSGTRGPFTDRQTFAHGENPNQWDDLLMAVVVNNYWGGAAMFRISDIRTARTGLIGGQAAGADFSIQVTASQVVIDPIATGSVTVKSLAFTRG